MDSRAQRLEAVFRKAFAPVHMVLEDESGQHAVGAGAQSHFRVVLVSEAFSGQSLLKRHRAVNQAAYPEFQRGLHALSIHAFSPEQWAEHGKEAAPSPPCLGGGS